MPERSNPNSDLGTYSLDVGDFNKDGRLDIFVINWGRGTAEHRDGVLLNIGSDNRLFPGGAAGIANPIGNEDEATTATTPRRPTSTGTATRTWWSPSLPKGRIS